MKIRRLLSLILAGTMVFTSLSLKPITAYAVSENKEIRTEEELADDTLDSDNTSDLSEAQPIEWKENENIESESEMVEDDAEDSTFDSVEEAPLDAVEETLGVTSEVPEEESEFIDSLSPIYLNSYEPRYDDEEQARLTSFTLSWDGHAEIDLLAAAGETFIKNGNSLSVNPVLSLADYNGSKPMRFTATVENDSQVGYLNALGTINHWKHKIKMLKGSDGRYSAEGYFLEGDHSAIPSSIGIEFISNKLASRVIESNKTTLSASDLTQGEISTLFSSEIFDHYEAINAHYPGMVSKTESEDHNHISYDVDYSQLYSEALDDTIDAVVHYSIDVYDEATNGTLSDFLGMSESALDEAGYFVKGINDEQYFMYADYADLKTYTTFAKKTSGAANKFVKYELSLAPGGSYDSLRAFSEKLDTATKVIGVTGALMNYETEYQERVETIEELPIYGQNRIDALREAEAIRNSQVQTTIITKALIPLMIAAVGGVSGGTSLILTGMMSMIDLGADFIWSLRAASITGGVVLTKAEDGDFVNEYFYTDRFNNVSNWEMGWNVTGSKTEGLTAEVWGNDGGEFGNGCANCNTNYGEYIRYVYIGEGFTNLNTFWGNLLEYIDLPYSLEIIPRRAFQNKTNLTSISIPGRVQEIGSYAFSNSGLRTIRFPGSLKTIGEHAFYECKSLETVDLGNGVKKLDSYAFANCTELKGTLKVPESLEQIGARAFASDAGIEDVLFSDDLETIGDYAFNNCSGITDLTIDVNVGSIGMGAFAGCSGLKSLKITGDVGTVGKDVFFNCGSLSKIFLPYSLMEAEFTDKTSVFRNSYAIRDVYFEGTEDEWTELGLTLSNESLITWHFEAEPDDMENHVKATRISVSPPSQTIQVGETTQLLATVSPDEANQKVIWGSSNESVAVVGSTGLVAGLKRGTVKITATTRDGSDLSASCMITVTAPSFTVSYDVNGHGTAPATTLVYTGSSLNRPVEPVASGYRFAGWYKEASCDNIWDFVYDKMPDHALTLYAKWIKTNRLFVDFNGGSLNGMDSISLEADQGTTNTIQQLIAEENGITLANDGSPAGSKPSRTKYTFVKWNTKIDGTGADVDITGILNTDMTLYAQWKIEEAYKATSPSWSLVSSAQLIDGTIGTDDATVYENASVKLTSSSADATILYRTNPDSEWQLYTDSIRISNIPVADKSADYYDDTKDAYTINIYALASRYEGGNSEVKQIRLTVLKDAADWGEVDDSDQSGVDYAYRSAADIPSGFWIAGLKASYDYKGSAYNFSDKKDDDDIRVYYGKKLLVNDTDYKISYKNNTDAYELTEGDEGYNASKAPTITISGKGNYAGTLTKTFKINPLNLSASTLASSDIYLKYNGKVQKPVNTLTYSICGRTIQLKANKDYSLIFPKTDKQITAGENAYDPNAFCAVSPVPYHVIVQGKGNYTGSTGYDVNIVNKAVSLMSALKYTIGNSAYTGEPVAPSCITVKNGSITLSEDAGVIVTAEEVASMAEPVDLFSGSRADKLYLYYLENNTNAGTAAITFVGNEAKNYVGTVTKTYLIKGTAIKASNITFTVGGNDYQLSGLPFQNYQYDGRVHYQENVGKLTLNKNKAGEKELILGEDYTVSCSPEDPVNAGTYTVEYNGISGLTGKLTRSYSVTAYDFAADAKRGAEDRKIHLTLPGGITYLKDGVRPVPSVTFGDVPLDEGTDYTVSYKNNAKVYELKEGDVGFDVKKAPTVTITGKGNFKGACAFTFTIAPSADPAALSICAADKAYSSKKGSYATTVTIRDANGKNLAAKTDYYASNDRNHPFEYTYVEDTGLANGTIRRKGEAVDENDIVPAGTLLNVGVTLKETGNYRNGGEALRLNTTFRIVEEDLSKATVKINAQYFTGREVCLDKSQMIVTLNKRILSDQDYEIISYNNNINKGTAKVTIRGVGRYGGEKTGSFRILSKPAGVTVSFNANRANGGTMTDMTITVGKSYLLNANKYKRKGCDFAGWNTKPDGSGTGFMDKQSGITAADVKAMAPDGLLILYAQWSPIEYTIKYHTNGISEEQNAMVNPITKYTVESRDIILAAPLRIDWPVGYRFGGWYTEEQLKVQISLIRTGSSGDVNLYAKWIPYTYKLRFDANLPDDYDPVKNGRMNEVIIPYGIQKALPQNAFKRAGYTFDGWAWDSNAEIPDYENQEKVLNLIVPRNHNNGTATLYAVWKVK